MDVRNVKLLCFSINYYLLLCSNYGKSRPPVFFRRSSGFVFSNEEVAKRIFLQEYRKKSEALFYHHLRTNTHFFKTMSTRSCILGKNGDNMICLPVFCFDDVFVRYRIEGIMHAQAIENLSAEIADGKIYWKV